MSKKIMKRSLVLGALMAFVITGNAMAEVINSATNGVVSITDLNTASNNNLKITTGADVNYSNLYLVDVSASQDVTVERNNIIIDGGSVKAENALWVVKANNTDANALLKTNNNTLKISGDGIEIESNNIRVANASGSNTSAKENTLEISSNASVKSNSIIGGTIGAAYGKNVQGNKIIIRDAATITGFKSMYAGYITGGGGTAQGNSIEINSATISVENIYGSHFSKDNSSQNIEATMKANKVLIKDATVTGDLYGAYSRTNFNGYDIENEISDNSVEIINANVTAGIICGAFAEGLTDEKIVNNSKEIKGNKVVINGTGTISAEKGIYGAYALSGGAGSNSVVVQGNIVEISGDVTIASGTKIYGGYAESIAQKDKSTTGTPTIDSDGNYIITGTTKPLTGSAQGLVANATGNTVNISGNAKVEGEVFAGYAAVYESGTTTRVSAAENIVTVSENADVSKATLTGSKTETLTEKEVTVNQTIDVSSGDLIADNGGNPTENNKTNNDTSAENTSNNTLNLSEDWTGGDGGKVINTVGNFDTIVLEAVDQDSLITINNLNLKEATTDSSTGETTGGTAIEVKKLQLGSGVKEGEEVEVKLFSDSTNIDSGKVNTEESKATIYVGTAELGNASLEDLTSGNATIKVQELDMNPQVLVIGESRAAATAFVNQGSELVETGLDALARDNAKAGDTKVFAAVYGNASEYATGSHVKVNGWSGIVGVGKTNDNGLTVGAFFENGDGNYRTYNVNAGTFMRGDGEAVYNGGGLLVRKDNANGVYTEASLRAGNLKNELKNAVMGKAGLDGYDVDTFYYGAHVGIGKVIPRGNEGDSIDVYGKFMYTHHDGETFNIQGDAYKFDSVDSERLRLGFRINEVQTNKLSMYYGAAWEYEFGGDADNKVVGYDLSTPSLEGSTVIGEIGMHYLASEKWSLDLNVRGYSGQRDGFTGSVQANYNF